MMNFCLILDTQVHSLMNITSDPRIQYFLQDNLLAHLSGKVVELIDSSSLECL